MPRYDCVVPEVESGRRVAPDGWYPDPFARAHRRYWTSSGWTDKVKRLPPWWRRGVRDWIEAGFSAADKVSLDSPDLPAPEQSEQPAAAIGVLAHPRLVLRWTARVIADDRWASVGAWGYRWGDPHVVDHTGPLFAIDLGRTARVKDFTGVVIGHLSRVRGAAGLPQVRWVLSSPDRRPIGSVVRYQESDIEVVLWDATKRAVGALRTVLDINESGCQYPQVSSLTLGDVPDECFRTLAVASTFLVAQSLTPPCSD
jgi:hypothetical protein